MRVYAIGDVHGCADLLDDLLERIAADDAARGPAASQMIFLGDLIDRGPRSRQVIERVGELVGAGEVRLLKGNHEEVFVAAARGEAKSARALIKIGGVATLQSYGLSGEEIEHGTFADLALLLEKRIPRAHIDMLDAAADTITVGDYLFVHAGIRPGTPLERQDPADLRWIREPFLKSQVDHGFVVVHGHTPVDAYESLPNRIGVDTGAYHSGVLTAVGLEGSERWFLQTDGRVRG